MSAPPLHIAAFARGLRPPPRLTVSEWADQYRQLPQEGAAEPGQWRTDRTPYLREIMDCMSEHHPAREVAFMKGAQIGGTEVILNALGYIMHHNPGPSMVVMPTDDTAKDWSRDRLGPMITASPELSELFSTSARDPNNATRRKKFPGGYIKIAHATSAAELRSKPVKNLVMDEVDGYPTNVDGEGDPVELAEARTRTFLTMRKVLKVSTPTFEATSRIKRGFEEGDQRRYFVPCPECGAFQVLRWEQVKWPKGQPEEAYYECEDCKARLEEHDKAWMLANGEWRATNPNAPEGVVSFHLSSLYAPPGWMSWAECAKKFVRAIESRSKDLLRVFINTILGEAWRDQGETPDWEKLYLRRDVYQRGTVPQGGLVLTLGVDVQRDRLEAEVLAWGPELRSWSVDYLVLHGDPSQPAVWDELDTVIQAEYAHDSGGRLKISKAAIDSGFETQHVYAFCRNYPRTLVMAVKGQSTLARPLGNPRSVDLTVAGRTIKDGVQLWGVGVDLIKDELYSWLLQPLPEEGADPPRGWAHWPQYGQDYFRGLTAEERQFKGGKQIWVKVFERNEPLDCRVYNRAAAIALGIDRWPSERWMREYEAILASADTPAAPAASANRRKRRRRADSNAPDWVNIDGW